MRSILLHSHKIFNQTLILMVLKCTCGTVSSLFRVSKGFPFSFVRWTLVKMKMHFHILSWILMLYKIHCLSSTYVCQWSERSQRIRMHSSYVVRNEILTLDLVRMNKALLVYPPSSHTIVPSKAYTRWSRRSRGEGITSRNPHVYSCKKKVG